MRKLLYRAFGDKSGKPDPVSENIQAAIERNGRAAITLDETIASLLDHNRRREPIRPR